MYYPYLQLYRKQVVKQADLTLAMHWRGDAFTPEEKARNFAYYEALTVRDSSLSACSQAVLAAEVGHLDLAYDYLGEAVLMDLVDLHHNTGERNGKRLDTDCCIVFEIANGRMVSGREHFFSLDNWDEFWS